MTPVRDYLNDFCFQSASDIFKTAKMLEPTRTYESIRGSISSLYYKKKLDIGFRMKIGTYRATTTYKLRGA